MSALLRPDWPAPARVHALMTTRAMGDMAGAAGRARLRELLPREPAWLTQVHGTAVAEAESAFDRPQADACVARSADAVCAVQVADCMPVLFADDAGAAVAAAHAGWRGLRAGVLESTVRAMRVSPAGLIAWLGPAIGATAYEVGDEVRAAFLERDPAAGSAFTRARAGHWMLDLYAEARRQLAGCGVVRVYGGGFCTHADAQRFFSFRRDRTRERMAALIWLT